MPVVVVVVVAVPFAEKKTFLSTTKTNCIGDVLLVRTLVSS